MEIDDTKKRLKRKRKMSEAMVDEDDEQIHNRARGQQFEKWEGQWVWW